MRKIEGLIEIYERGVFPGKKNKLAVLASSDVTGAPVRNRMARLTVLKTQVRPCTTLIGRAYSRLVTRMHNQSKVPAVLSIFLCYYRGQHSAMQIFTGRPAPMRPRITVHIFV